MPTFANPWCWELPTEAASNGCFETMRAYDGRIFRLGDHLDRLAASAQFLGTPLPSTRRRLTQQLLAALERSHLTEAIVRIAVFPRPGAKTAGGTSRREPSASASIVVQPVALPPTSAYRRGIRVAIVPARKFPVGAITPQAKYSARLGSVLAVMDAQLRRADEALFMDAMGYVAESTASNFSMVRGGVILTSPCWVGLLAGVTRDVLVELARTLRLAMREVPLTRHELYNAEEAFITSTIKEVLPVTWIDGRRVGSGHPGPVTKRLHRAFRDLVRRELRLS